jgi:hypothetical protein
MAESAEPVPKRKEVRAAVRETEHQLVNVRPRDMPNAALLRQTKKAIADLDAAHEAYCAKLERRASARATRLRQECDKRTEVARQMVQDARAVTGGDPEADAALRANAEAFVATTKNVNGRAKQAHAAVKRTDDRIRRAGDRFVIGALRAARSKNGGRAFLKRVSQGADIAIGTTKQIPAAAPWATGAGIAKKAAEFLVKRVDKGPKAAVDQRYETAITAMRSAELLMRNWAATIK